MYAWGEVWDQRSRVVLAKEVGYQWVKTFLFSSVMVSLWLSFPFYLGSVHSFNTFLLFSYFLLLFCRVRPYGAVVQSEGSRLRTSGVAVWPWIDTYYLGLVVVICEKGPSYQGYFITSVRNNGRNGLLTPYWNWSPAYFLPGEILGVGDTSPENTIVLLLRAFGLGTPPRCLWPPQ